MSAPSAASTGLRPVAKWQRGRGRQVAVGLQVAVALLVVPWAFVSLWLPEPHVPPRVAFCVATPALLNFSIPAVTLALLESPSGRGPLPADSVVGNNPSRSILPVAHGVTSIVAGAVVLAGWLVLFAHRVPGRQLSEDDERLVIATLVALVLAT